MFYSQFILAKKGPLGTIWIAAHLERKLRKNQVADTDIGVSVDSILFPEVPIALRLSSHLLLGVVRIYSRKVNYLFDDCSEALLKIKQAFRSTAVDLPPEESTAPYHSITLPETFDLDDFELPDNEIFQGNYVDHHVSTREQITLQDTMEGVVYSTSQFGLDERFGDGDTSQIGLDIDEELFLDKVAASGHGNSVTNAHVSTEFTPPPKNDTIVDASEAVLSDCIRNQDEDPVANSENIEDAQAPLTPGLTEVPNLSSVQEALAFDDHFESEDHPTKILEIEHGNTTAGVSELYHGDKAAVNWSLHNELTHDTIVCTSPRENGSQVSDLEIIPAKGKKGLPSTALSMECTSVDGTTGIGDGSNKAELRNGIEIISDQSMHFVDHADGEYEESMGSKFSENIASPSSHVTSDLGTHSPKISSSGTCHLIDGQVLPMPKIHNDAETSNHVEESFSLGKAAESTPVCPMELSGGSKMANVDDQDGDGTKFASSDSINGEMLCTRVNVLKACSSSFTQPDKLSVGCDTSMVALNMHSLQSQHTPGASIEVQGDVNNLIQSEENQIPEPSLCGEVPADSRRLDEQLGHAIFNDENLDNLKGFEASNLPAPEKLLSAPEILLDEPNGLLVESTPNQDVLAGDDRSEHQIKLGSGKKRSFTESTLTVQSINSHESFGVTRLTRTVESIPDDDDLLSSILVGRRSSVLKLKPTPSATEVTSTKRARSAPRASALKRKVLMDDIMVLHGDTIRQQLTNTVDIRRIRKKAPCTRPEILMIHRQFLEEEIFNESIFTGMSEELIRLHSETYDLSGTRIAENDENNASLGAGGDTSFSVDVAGERGVEGSTEHVIPRNIVEAQPVIQHNESPDLSSHDTGTQGHVSGSTDLAELLITQNIHLPEIIQMEIESGSSEIANAANQSVGHWSEMLPSSCPDSGDIGNWPAGSANHSEPTDITVLVKVTLPDRKTDDEGVEKDASLVNISNGRVVDAIKAVDHSVKNFEIVETECTDLDGLLLAENKVCDSVGNGADAERDVSTCTDNGTTSLETVPLEVGEFVNGGADDRSNELKVVHEDVIVSADLGSDDKYPYSNYLCSEEPKLDPTYSLQQDMDMKNYSPNDQAVGTFQDTDVQRPLDADISAFDHHGTGDWDERENVAAENDTEFLNVDDDEMVEDDDDGMPSAGETGLLENSGWSSRTRAVAKYLQTLFEKEVHGRKTLFMDHLLGGKTRKEASRMFFETLVLKTKDYIHVEQAKPFESINIRPRAKLMKSDF